MTRLDSWNCRRLFTLTVRRVKRLQKWSSSLGFGETSISFSRIRVRRSSTKQQQQQLAVVYVFLHNASAGLRAGGGWLGGTSPPEEVMSVLKNRATVMVFGGLVEVWGVLVVWGGTPHDGGPNHCLLREASFNYS